MASRFTYRSSAQRVLSADATEQIQRTVQTLPQTTPVQQTSGVRGAFGTTGGTIAAPQKFERVISTCTPGTLKGLKGRKTVIPPRGSEENKRSLKRENEAAVTIAKKGFYIVQNPKIKSRKKPDYRIQGKVYDCYSPAEDTGPKNIRKTIMRKITSGQTARVVLNLDDWKTKGTDSTYVQDVRDLITFLEQHPIPGLKGVMIVRDGEVRQL